MAIIAIFNNFTGEKMSKYIRNITLLTFALLLLSACGTITSVGKYGNTIPKEKVDGSWGQAKKTFVVNFDAADSRAAVVKAFGLEGLDFEVKKNNVLSGASPSMTYAVYIKQLNRSPKTTVTFVADYQTFFGGAFATSNAKYFVAKIAKHFNTIISNYD